MMTRVKQFISRYKSMSLAFSLVALLCVSSITSQAEIAQTEKGLLWKISGKQTTSPSYLFGTIHSDHPSVMKLHPDVATRFSSARSFSGEVIFDHEASLRLLELMKLPGGITLPGLLDKQTYQRVKDITSELGIVERQLVNLRPWAVAVTMSLPKRESELFLDTRLFADAINMGKPVYGLESIDEQLSGFKNMSLDDQVIVLKETIDQHHLFDAMFDKIIALYLKRDLAALMQLDQQLQELSDPRIQQYLREELMIKRNHRMLKNIKLRLAEGNAFIAVGALHLPGDEGLIALLREDGYRVEVVY